MTGVQRGLAALDLVQFPARHISVEMWRIPEVAEEGGEGQRGEGSLRKESPNGSEKERRKERKKERKT